VLGLGWAIVQPLFTTGVMTLIFGSVAGMSKYSDPVPNSIWTLAAVVLMTFFQSASTDVGSSLISNLGVVTKVYFPRLTLPLVALAGRVFDLFIMLLILGIGLFVMHGQLLARGCHIQLCALWVVPLALVIVAIASLALGLWLAGLSVQYRDVRAAQGLLLQLLMYASPVIYPASRVLSKLQLVHNEFLNSHATLLSNTYYINPIAGAIESVRGALFSQQPIGYGHLALGGVVAVIGFIGGLWCFRKAENLVADVA